MASPLEPLERLTARARNLEEFLSRPAWIEDYYGEAARFFGEERFPRAVFDEIIAQLRVVAREVPEIGPRLWALREPERSFAIRVSARSFGRTTSRRAWESYLCKWIGTLPETDLAETRRILEALNASVADFEAGIEGFSKRKKDARRIEFYRKLRCEPGAVAAASSMLRYHLVTNPGRNILRCGDTDFLLHELERWRQHPEGVGNPELRALTEPIASLIRSLIPKRSELLGRAGLFPPVRYTTRKGKSVRVGGSSSGEYSFVTVARPFHAIWRGLTLNECVGGYAHDLKSNHPARWSIPACQGALTLFVTKGKRFQGYVQLTPITRGDETYASLELQAPVLAKPILAVGNTSLPLFELCLSELARTMPPDCRGLLVSESFDANEAGCSDSLRKSPAYLLGDVVGGCRDFSVRDAVSERIACLLPRLGIAAHYPNGLIFDANLPNSGWLRRLRIVR